MSAKSWKEEKLVIPLPKIEDNVGLSCYLYLNLNPSTSSSMTSSTLWSRKRVSAFFVSEVCTWENQIFVFVLLDLVIRSFFFWNFCLFEENYGLNFSSYSQYDKFYFLYEIILLSISKFVYLLSIILTLFTIIANNKILEFRCTFPLLNMNKHYDLMNHNKLWHVIHKHHTDLQLVYI